MSVVEKLQIDYDYLIEYLEDAMNAIGATTSTTLRNITAHNDGNSIYVRKFGLPYAITNITNMVINTPRSDGGGANSWWYYFHDIATDDLLAAVQDINAGSNFVDAGTVPAGSGIYIKVFVTSGTATPQDGDTITLTTNLGVLTVYLSGESLTGTNDKFWYLSATGSTYYDENYMYGGYRHTPDSTSLLPYFDITTAIADPDTTGFTITTVLDSAVYDEQPVISIACMILQADEGYTPKITSGIGPRVTREVSVQYNNATAVYVNETGNDADPGTWQEPFLTIPAAITGRGGKHIVYGGTGATVGTFAVTATITIPATAKLEADYGYMPTINSSNTTQCIINNGFFYGFICNSLIDAARNVDMNTASTEIKDCTVTKGRYGVFINNDSVVVQRNIINSAWGSGIEESTDRTGTDIQYNFISECDNGISFRVIGNHTTAITVNHNIIYNNNNYGIYILNAGIGNYTVNGTLDNNLLFNNDYGCNFDTEGAAAITLNATVDNIIFKSNTTYGIFSDAIKTINYCNFDDNGTDYNGNITSTNEIAGDPKLCRITAPYKFGLSADSPCYRADAGADDVGPILRIIEINASTITINGFIIDGQNYYNNAIYILDDVNHITTTLKWNSVYDFQGIAIDLYDDDTNTNATISNCKIYNNGNGIKLERGGNTVEENLIYNNAIYGIWSDWTGQIFNHNVFYGNQYGLYLESNSGSILIKNSIFHGNSIRGIYSEISISITYCCITDGTTNVDITDDSNTTDNPLFLNELPGTEDFNIKTTFGGFSAVSPCYLASDDSPVKDIGAYDVERSVAEEAWKKYVLYSNPANMNIDNKAPGQVSFMDALGSSSLWAKAHKLVFPMEWEENTLTDEEQKDKIKYISTIIQKREGRNPRTKIQSRLRLRIKPSAHLENGTNGVVDSANKKLTDTAMLLTEDKFKGYNMGVIFASGTGMVVDSVAKTGTKGGAGWTINQWRGFYFKYNGYTYFIKSNSATVLTLSDPYSTLISATVPYSLEKYFEIEEHDNTGIFYLIDDNDELVDGTYSYYMDFAVTRIMDSKFGYKQPKFAYDKPEWMSGYSLIMRQV